MKLVRTMAFFLMSVMVATAADLSAERTWTGNNGKTFRGTFARFSSDRQTVDFLTTAGKVVTIRFSNLSLADQELLVPPPQAPVPMGDKAAFKPDPEAARGLVTALLPKEYARVRGYTELDTLWLSMLWWDTVGVLELPKKGDLPRRAEWLKQELFRHIVKDSRKLSGWDACEKGVKSFFEEELKEVAACRIYREHTNFTVARLFSFARGANVVALQLYRKSTEGPPYCITAAVESITQDGIFAIYAYGKRFTGKITPLEEDAVEFVVENRQDLPVGIAAGDAKFVLNYRLGVCEAFVVKPYVFVTMGASSPPPPDETFNFGSSPPASPAKSDNEPEVP